MLREGGISTRTDDVWHDKGLKDTNNWLKGEIKIYGLQLSGNIQVDNCSYLPLGYGLGDHRDILVDIHLTSLVETA